MTIATELRDAALAELDVDPALVVTMAAADDVPAPDPRDRRTREFAAAVAALWQRYQDGELTEAEFEAAVQDLVSQTTDEVVRQFARENGVDPLVLADRTSTIALRLGAQAVIAATGSLHFFDPSGEGLSDAMIAARANRVAGPLWALHFAVEPVAMGMADPEATITGTWEAEMDENTCSPCAELDGEEFTPEDAPVVGETCEGGDSCRCKINWTSDPGDALMGGMTFGE